MRKIKPNTILSSFTWCLVFVFPVLINGCNNGKTQEVETTLVEKGIFKEELIEEGILQAVNSININAPKISYRFGALKIANIVDDGSEVKKGDTLIIFDPSEVKKSIVDIEQKLEIQHAELEKMEATQKSEIEDLKADLEISKIDLEISKINFEQSVYEAEITKKEIQLKLENAQLALERAAEQIENKKKIHKVDLFQKNISIAQLEKQLEGGKEAMDQLIIVSPANGIAIIDQNWMSRQKWKEGDQPYSGSKILDLPDLDKMRVDVSINEVDAMKITRGLPVVITPDAFSDSIYSGELSFIANLAKKKDPNSKIKVFPIEISIFDNNETLMPGLTVRCKIKISEQSDALLIPIDAVFRDELGEFAYVKSGAGFKRKGIQISKYNTDFACIETGLKEHEEVALLDPFMNKMEDNGENTSADITNQ